MGIAIFIMNIAYAALIQGGLLFLLTQEPCGDNSRAATIQSSAFIRGNTVLCIDNIPVYVQYYV